MDAGAVSTTRKIKSCVYWHRSRPVSLERIILRAGVEDVEGMRIYPWPLNPASQDGDSSRTFIQLSPTTWQTADHEAFIRLDSGKALSATSQGNSLSGNVLSISILAFSATEVSAVEAASLEADIACIDGPKHSLVSLI